MALIKCPECGNEISDSSAVCIHCGYQLNDATKKRRRGVLRITAIASGAFLLAAGILLVLWKVVFPDLFLTAEELLTRGDYQSAYNKAETDEERKAIADEYAVAAICADGVNSLKDPASFVLEDAGYIGRDEFLILVSAKNSYGGYVTSYWLGYYNETSGEFYYSTTWDDLEEEEIYSWDDPIESLNKAGRNGAKYEVSLKLALGMYQFLSDESIANINALSAAGLLDEIKHIKLPEEFAGTDLSDQPASDDTDVASTLTE